MTLARLSLLFTVCICTAVAAQNPSAPQAQPEGPPAFSASDLAAKVPAAKPEDVKSIDSIMHAIYDTISGPVGDRDWSRFRSLFFPQARFTDTKKSAQGEITISTWSVDEFVHDAGAVFQKESFYESSIVNQVSSFGNIAQVFSSYESRHQPAEKPFQRGVNSVQLLNDGKRWWVLSILWDSERPDNPLPAKLAKKH
jgi:hypothetical protein